MSDFYVILTDAGQALMAAATAGGAPVVLTQFGVDDGNGAAITPAPEQTALVNEVYRANISSLSATGNTIKAQLVIPKDSGGYTVQGFGLYTDDGTLFSVSNFPAQEKPLPSSGYAANMDTDYYLQVSDTSAVTLIVNGDDYLTREQADTIYLQIGNNLSEIATAGAAAQEATRDNLGLGSAAVCEVQTSKDDVTPGRVLINGGTFVIAANQVQLLTGAATFSFSDNGDFYAPRAINIGDTDTGFLANGDGSAIIRANNTNIGKWDSASFELTVNAKLKGGVVTPNIELQGGPAVIDFHHGSETDDYNFRLYNDGDNKLTLYASDGNPILNNQGKYIAAASVGAWASEFNSQTYSPYNTTYVNAQDGDAWCPIITGGAGKNNGFPTYTAFGYYIPPGNSFNHPTICATGDSGAFARWMFNFSSGDITFANQSTGRTVAFQDWVQSSFISGIRLANYGVTGGDLRDSAQTVMTGIYATNGYDNATTHEHRQVQYQVAGNWYNAPYV